MVNIILVDDEVLALDYLKNLIDWEAHGYHVAGCATSGKKALELYDKWMPEIVISDIRMPVMDGLELTRHLKKKNGDVMVMLLSAYGDFEYAKKGIEYGVSNYLLKHELSEELLLTELDRMRRQLLKDSRRNKIYQKYFMEQLIYNQRESGNTEEPELGHRLFLIFLHKRNPVQYGEFVEEKWNGEERKAIMEILEEGLEDKIFYVSDVTITDNNWAVLYRIENTASKYTVNSLIERKCMQIGDRLRRLPECRFNMIYSFEIRQCEISETFRKMSRQIRYAVFWDVDKSYSLQDIPSGEKKIFWGEQVRSLRDAVYAQDENPAQVIRGFFSNLQFEEKLDACRSLMPLLNSLLREIEEKEDIKVAEEGKKLYTMGEIIRDYEEKFLRLHQQIMWKDEGEYSRLIRDIMHYIRKNYSQELSLDTLGEKFQMNGVYLGQMFKKEVGITFLRYLTGVRIEEAKRLLKEENCTIAEAAEKIGYRTSQYFSKVFTREVGMKPQEYKKWEEKT